MLFFLFCSLVIKAQQPATIHLTEKDGLPDIEFYNIIEDKKQFIWLAADNGLYRYDGKNYKYYSHQKQRGNAVFGVLEDNNGRVWCNNISGQFFYVEDDKMELFLDLGTELNGELPQFKISKTHLLIFTGRTIYKVSLKNKKIIKVYKAPFSLVGMPLKFGDNYYYTKGNSIKKTNASLRVIDSLGIEIYNNYNVDSVSRYANLATNGNLFFCYFLKYNKNVFFQFNFEDKRIEELKVPKQLESRRINQVFFKDDAIWIATDLGIQIFKLKGRSLEFQNTLFKKINVTKIITDSNNNYWITTKGDGVYVIPNINIFQYEIPNDLTSINKIKAVSPNTILFGTNNGRIATLDIEKNKLKLLDSSSAYRVSEIILDDTNKNAIIIKEDFALNYNIDTNTNKKISKPLLFGAKSLSSVKNIGYVLSSYKDAFLLDKSYNEIKQLVSKRSYTNYYSEFQKQIYIGTIGGLFSFDKDLTETEIKHNGMPILAISITETNDNTLWISTFKNGIYGIRNNNIISNYTTKNGLLSNKTGVLQSDNNHLWISTEKGVQYLNTETKKIKNLTKQNGIPSYRISDIEVIGDEVFFATNTGIFGLNKTKAFNAPLKRVIYFTQVKVNDSLVSLKDKFNYKQNNISFGFNTNGFQSNSNITYKYRLLGLDSVWKKLSLRINSIEYNSLPSGNYTFEVKSVNTKAEEKSIQFKIERPFWSTWWFYSLVLIICGITVYYFFQSKLKKVQAKQSELLQKEMINKQLIMSQLENLRSQMNPHFIFNALNSIQEYIVLNEKNLASSYLIKFSRLIRIYLEHSRESEVLISEEITALNLYLELEKNRFEDVLDYQINISENLDVNKIKIPSLFIQPYVENAIKHGLLHKKKNRNLNVDFNYNVSKKIIVCSIEDNGIGVEASKKINQERYPNHKSFATSANQKRVALLNTNRYNKITVAIKDLKSENKNGTVVIITIPLK